MKLDAPARVAVWEPTAQRLFVIAIRSTLGLYVFGIVPAVIRGTIESGYLIAFIAILLALLAIGSAAPRAAYAMFLAHRWWLVVASTMLIALRVSMPLPNQVYLPLIGLAFVVAVFVDLPVTLATAAVYAIGGVLIFPFFGLSGLWNEDFDYAAYSYAFGPDAALLLLHGVFGEYKRSAEKIGAMLPTVKEDFDSSPPLSDLSIVERNEMARLMGLTEGQTRVVAALIEGGTDAELAEQLNLSPRTIQSHLRSAMQRTGSSHRVALAVLAALTVVEIRERELSASA